MSFAHHPGQTDPPDLTRRDICKIIASFVPLRYADAEDPALPKFNFRGFRLQSLDLDGLLLQGDFDCADLRGSNLRGCVCVCARARVCVCECECVVLAVNYSCSRSPAASSFLLCVFCTFACGIHQMHARVHT